MSKPYIHALSSVKKYGGTVENYLDIHSTLDSSKSALADNRHRALTHNSWFIGAIIEQIFGVTRVNSEGKVYSVRDIAEDHVSEDFHGFIPSAVDFLAEMEMKDWMQNGQGFPPSYAKIMKKINSNQSENKSFADLEKERLKENESIVTEQNELVKSKTKKLNETKEHVSTLNDTLAQLEESKRQLSLSNMVVDGSLGRFNRGGNKLKNVTDDALSKEENSPLEDMVFDGSQPDFNGEKAAEDIFPSKEKISPFKDKMKGAMMD